MNDLKFGTGDFTIEMWVYQTGLVIWTLVDEMEITWHSGVY